MPQAWPGSFHDEKSCESDAIRGYAVAAIMKKHHPLHGFGLIAFALFGIGYLVRFVQQAFATGQVTGRLGAIHESGSIEYFVAIAGCAIGLALFLVLIVMGLRFAGIHASRDAR